MNHQEMKRPCIKLQKTNVTKQLRQGQQKVRQLLKDILFGVFILCFAIAGCYSGPAVVTVTPQQKGATQLTKGLGVKEPATEQPYQPNLQPASAPSTKPAEPTVTTNTTIGRQFESGKGPSLVGSDVFKARTKTIEAFAKAQIDPREEISPASHGTVNKPEQVSSKTHINMPVLSRPGMADELISVNFDQVDIRSMLKTIGDITGINFVVDESVSGTVTVMSPTKIPLCKIYSFLESILEVAGYAAVPADGIVKVVPRAGAATRNLQVCIGSNPSDIPQGDAIITQIMPLSYADAGEVSEIIRPLLATGSHMATYPRTNSIVITDTSSNIYHVAKIIQRLDVTGVEKKVTVIGLTYASAQVLGEQINRIMQTSKVTSSPPGRNRSISQTETDIKILPDIRTNSLIVLASAQDAQAIEQLAGSLDVPRPSRASNVHVIYLKNARAKETAESLTAAVSNMRIAGALEATQEVQVSADEGTNALIITASAQDYELIAEIIEKLDIVREQVLVEMLIVEISEDALQEIGIDWATLDEAVANSMRVFGQTNFGPRMDFITGEAKGLSVGAWKRTQSGVGIAAILHALQETSSVNILSTPHILTSNHQKANIIVGENIPFVMQSRITETDPATPTSIKTFEYRDVGIILDITPHISQSGLIRLEIDSEFTKFIDTGSILTQRTTKRQAQTNVTMNSGSTVVIGGLIRDDNVTVERKIPLVGDIPLVGELFKFRRDRLQKTNLLIFITPHIMGTQKDLDRMTQEKKKEMEPALENLQQRMKTN